MSEKMSLSMKKAITPPFRVAFPHVFAAHTGFEGQEPKFSIVMLFDKKTDLKKSMKEGYASLVEAVHNAATEKFGPKEQWPKGLRTPFRNGDEKPDLQGYAGTLYCTASSKQKPQVVGQNLSPITAEDGSFYAGCYARAEIVAFAYDTLGNKGVSLALNNVQKLSDGDAFSGRKNAADVFDKVEDSSEDKASYPQSDTDGMGF